MENLFETAKNEREQFLDKNKKLSNALNITQDKYSIILKKLAVIQIEILEV